MDGCLSWDVVCMVGLVWSVMFGVVLCWSVLVLSDCTRGGGISYRIRFLFFSSRCVSKTPKQRPENAHALCSSFLFYEMPYFTTACVHM